MRPWPRGSLVSGIFAWCPNRVPTDRAIQRGFSASLSPLLPTLKAERVLTFSLDHLLVIIKADRTIGLFIKELEFAHHNSTVCTHSIVTP